MGKLAVVNTDDIALRELNASWVRYLSTYLARDPDDMAVSGIAFEPHGGVFRGSIEYGDLGGGRLCRVASTSHRYIRNPGSTTDANAAALLVLQMRGTTSVCQDDRRSNLAPGDWNVYDTAKPFSITSFGPAEHLLLLAARGTIEPMRGVLGTITKRAFGRDGTERTVRDLMTNSFLNCHRISQRSGEAVMNSLLQLVHAALGDAADADATPQRCLKSLIVDYIEANLSDECLGVGQIASSFGYSTRQIHRTFQDETGMTVSDYIWRRRLEHSFNDLKSSASQGQTITEIAFRWGFSSAAHFSRAFKTTYGVTPRQCRLAQA